MPQLVLRAMEEVRAERLSVFTNSHDLVIICNLLQSIGEVITSSIVTAD